MQLKRRIMFILLLAMALLVTALGMMGWLGEQRWAQRYNEVLLQTQRIAWDKLQNENLDRQDALARKLLEDPSFRNLQASGAQQRIDRLLANAVRQAPGLRIDILGPTGGLLSTTEPGFDPQPLAEYGWVKAAMEAPSGVRGLSQVAPRQYDWVVVRGFEGGALAEHLGQGVTVVGGAHQVAAEGQLGVLALGEQGAQALDARAQGVEGDHVALGFGEIEGGRDQLLVLLEHHQGLAAEGLGTVPHLGQLLALVGGELDEAGEELFEGGEGRVHGGHVAGGEVEGDEVLAHGVESCVDRRVAPVPGAGRDSRRKNAMEIYAISRLMQNPLNDPTIHLS